MFTRVFAFGAALFTPQRLGDGTLPRGLENLTPQTLLDPAAIGQLPRHKNVILPYSSGYFSDALESGNFSVFASTPLSFPGVFRQSNNFHSVNSVYLRKPQAFWNSMMSTGYFDLPLLTPIPYIPAPNTVIPHTPVSAWLPRPSAAVWVPPPSPSHYKRLVRDPFRGTWTWETDHGAWSRAYQRWHLNRINAIAAERAALAAYAEHLAYVDRLNQQGRERARLEREAINAENARRAAETAKREQEIAEIEFVRGQIEIRNQHVEFIVTKQRQSVGTNFLESYTRQKDRKQNQSYLRALQFINNTYGHEVWDIAGAIVQNSYYSDGPLKDSAVRFGRLTQFPLIVKGLANGSLYLDFPGFLKTFAMNQLEDRFFGEVGQRVRNLSIDADKLVGFTAGPAL